MRCAARDFSIRTFRTCFLILSLNTSPPPPRPSHRDISAEHREAHIPQTTAYRFGECLSDLLDLSSRYLRLGGRLVFFIPWADTVCVDSDLEPVRKHPFLKLKYMCDQLLNYKYR